MIGEAAYKKQVQVVYIDIQVNMMASAKSCLFVFPI